MIIIEYFNVMWCIFTAKCLNINNNNISKTKQFLYLTITRDPPNFTTTKLNISNFKTELWPNTDVVCLYFLDFYNFVFSFPKCSGSIKDDCERLMK